MRIAIADYLLRVPDAQVCAAARSAGCDGVEITHGPFAGPDWPVWSPEGNTELRKSAEQAGVQLCSLSASSFLWQNLPALSSSQREALSDLLVMLVRSAARLGIPVVHVPCLDLPVPREAAERRRILDLLADALENAHALGVTLALETLWPAEECRVLANAAGSDHLRFCLDLGNSRSAGRDPAAELALLGPLLGQVRVKERAKREPFASVPLGAGGLDWQSMLRALQASPAGTGSAWLILVTPAGTAPLASAQGNVAFLRRLLSADRVAAA